jgi:hypothetical protein
LEKIKDYMGSNQYSLIGTRNVWILKPGGKSRGRGITVQNKLESIINAI